MPALPASDLPPLLREQQREVGGVVVPPPHSSAVHASSARLVVRQLLREAQVSAGHRSAAPDTDASGLQPSAPRAAARGKHTPRGQRDTSCGGVAVSRRELARGLICCINRGTLPADADLSGLLAGDNRPGGALCIGPAALRPHQEQFHRRELLTADYSFAPVCNVKLDMQAVLFPERVAQQKPVQVPTDTVPDMPYDTDHLGNRQRDETRTYAELLDLYSLHEFVIRKGQTLSATPEFESYRRSFKEQWTAISALIAALEAFLKHTGVPLAYIDGKRVAELAGAAGRRAPSDAELLSCIANRDEVAPLMKGALDRQADLTVRQAAVKIQALMRGHLSRLRVRGIRHTHTAAATIQKQWLLHLGHIHTRRALSAAWQRDEQEWRQQMDQFIRQWAQWRKGPRTVIHIPSLSHTAKQCCTLPFYDCLQNGQLMRLLDLADPEVELIYVSPHPLEAEGVLYYMKLLQMNGVDSPERRLHVLTPENRSRLPEGMSLSRTCLSSQRVLKRLASLALGKRAYIVPGVVGKEDLALAAKLRLPMLGADPATAPHFAGKSGSKRIFEAADVVCPIGAYDMFEESELVVILSKFVTEYRADYSRWLIKIDHEFGGRGLAYLDTGRLQSLAQAEADACSASETRERVYLELRDNIARRAKIVTPTLYPDWAAFVQDFNTHGGVLEAVPPDCVSSPTAHIFISPDGVVELLSVQEQMLSPQYCCTGVRWPQTSVPHEAVRDAALSVGSVCYQKKVMGHVSMDFVVYRNKQQQLRMWAVDLDLHLTGPALAHRLFEFTAGCKADPATGTCYAEAQTGPQQLVHRPLCYAYSGLLYHPYIGALRHSVFFNHCRQRGLAFDAATRTGTIFHLVDTLLKGCVGALCIGADMVRVSTALCDFVDFLVEQLGSGPAPGSNIHHATAAAHALARGCGVERFGPLTRRRRQSRGAASLGSSPGGARLR
eukprot:TRINITY_DN12903_c0_g1_i2.p1 TRINITY_DN12903_c0_g1~~TRINITY_DN12903_c0_g1_i2.p1  ORF type:complete len:950 (+),score=248.72 TRINITY_DN12903_c0_g1_i2:105-2954(+)